MKTELLEQKRKEIEKAFIELVSNMGMDTPTNFDKIVDFIFDDVCETADWFDWSNGDVVIGFRRWIESRK